MGCPSSQLLYHLLGSTGIVVGEEVADSHSLAGDEAVHSFEVCRQLEFDARVRRAAIYG